MRQPDWDVDKARGEEAETLWRNTRTAMATGTAEVKRDDRAFDTGNFYIEHSCRTAQGWKPSGIKTTKAHTWVFVCWPILIALPVWILRQLHADAERKQDIKECSNGSHPTKGAVVPVDLLLKRAMWVAQRPLSGEEKAA